MTDDAYLLPASFGQERLWLLDQAQPGTPSYNISGALRLRGPLRVDRLERSLAAIVARHEVLRTVLRLDREGVAQLVRAAGQSGLVVSDVAGGPEAALARAADLAARPFDLRTGPLFRCHLLRLAPDDHLLVVVIHHVIADGWSIRILLAELTTGYAADDVTAGAELPVQYADYAVWQRELLASDALAGQLAYWSSRLADAQPLRLPADRPPPAVPSYAAHPAPITLPAAAVGRLGAGAGDLTPFMIAASGLAVLLARWSGQTDVVLAVPVAGRPQPELESLIGFFVNTLPLRVELAPDHTFATVLTQVRDRCLEAYANADVPFELLVEQLRPNRRAGQTPLAQVMLALDNTPAATLPVLPGIALELVELPTSHAQFDLLVDLAETPAGLAGELVVHADVFDAATAGALARSLTDLLVAAAGRPDTAVSELPCPVAGDRPWPDPAAVTSWETPTSVRPATVEPPRGPAEQLLARIWASVLERDSVGVNQNFYDLGGNSMRAVRVVVTAREQGLEVPFELVLGEHTIRDLTGDPKPGDDDPVEDPDPADGLTGVAADDRLNPPPG